MSGLLHAASPGESAPPFLLSSADGNTIALDKLRGRVVYLDFWASWCGPCRRSFPWMNAMQRKYGNQGLTIVGINVDKKRTDAERFLQGHPAQFTVLYDPSGTAPAAYSIKGMPSSYLIDRNGKVVAAEQGFGDKQGNDLEVQIRELLSN